MGHLPQQFEGNGEQYFNGIGSKNRTGSILDQHEEKAERKPGVFMKSIENICPLAVEKERWFLS